jgi:hypothetical protein
MVHQAMDHHPSQQVLMVVLLPVLVVLTTLHRTNPQVTDKEVPAVLVVLVVLSTPHRTNPQVTDKEVPVVLLVLMLLLLHLTVPTRTKMVVLILMNSNNSTKVVYKQNKFFHYYFSHKSFFYIFPFHTSLRKLLFILISDH